MGQGRENARAFLKENVEIRDRLESELRAVLGLGGATAAQPASEATAGGVRGRVVAH